jgi:formylglycine-generating enzyme required for sulfatase activity
VLVPGGRFFMGTDSTSPALALARPSHKVAIDTFCIDAFEVTAEDYKSCSDQGDCKRPETKPVYPKGDKETQAEHDKKVEVLAELCNFGKPDRDKHPINCVSWTLSSAYCNARGKRLPTEAEWEFAARGSDGRKFPWGDDPGDHTFMNACGAECNKWEGGHTLPLTNTMFPGDDGFFGTAPVGSFPKGKTKYGAFDVVGNVWEWTSDFFATYTPDEAINPKGPPVGDRHAIRGGAFNGGVPEWLDPAFRYHQVTEASVAAIGFRCARSL